MVPVARTTGLRLCQWRGHWQCHSSLRSLSRSSSRSESRTLGIGSHKLKWTRNLKRRVTGSAPGPAGGCQCPLGGAQGPRRARARARVNPELTGSVQAGNRSWDLSVTSESAQGAPSRGCLPWPAPEVLQAAGPKGVLQKMLIRTRAYFNASGATARIGSLGLQYHR